jgi:uncharacterized membrane protein
MEKTVKILSGKADIHTGDLVILTHELLNHVSWFNDRLAVVLETDEDGCRVWTSERAVWVRWLCIKKL